VELRAAFRAGHSARPDQIDRRFDQVDRPFDQVDGRFDHSSPASRTKTRRQEEGFQEIGVGRDGGGRGLYR